MPRYELCYILASSVSDDQVPAVTEQIQKFITDFGGKNVIETQLGKKKLAYPIKKTRNGFYVLDQFEIPSSKINPLEAKIRSQTGTIIRHIIINMEEHLERLEKDREVQAKMPKRREPIPTEDGAVATPAAKPIEKVEVAEVEEKAPAPKIELDLDTEALDKKIDDALTESIK